ncbi:hypothetical protein D3C87_1698950 [compost metagenome]
MQDDVGIHHFFQRCAESGHQVVRQVGNETHRVAQHHLAAMRQRDLADGRVQRGEQQVLGEHPCPGQHIEQA